MADGKANYPNVYCGVQIPPDFTVREDYGGLSVVLGYKGIYRQIDRESWYEMARDPRRADYVFHQLREECDYHRKETMLKTIPPYPWQGQAPTQQESQDKGEPILINTIPENKKQNKKLLLLEAK